MIASVVVVGLGEVGGPLLTLVSKAHPGAVGVDVEPVALPPRGSVDVMHICFPFDIDDFIGEAARYIDLVAPRLTVINSTVAVGTTRAVHERIGAPIAYSPVRGKHVRMLDDLTCYVKFVGGIDEDAGQDAARHLQSLGMRTRVLPTSEAAELAKLSETTYFGLLIAWAQEVERYCDKFGVDYDDVVAFFEEIGYLPPAPFFPGVIGGHCVMPNIEILRGLLDSELLDAIRSSNEQKIAREAARGDVPEALGTGAAL